ncbi:MAG: class I SAM-dependent methyltransferase [Myxococcales bacterium]|nr:class I SAM-dependent methyltransferase [Myxococcales bacterium]
MSNEKRMAMSEDCKCPLCASGESKEFRYSLRECAVCGLVFDERALLRESERNAAAFESETFVEPNGWVRLLQRRNARKAANRLGKSLAPGASVLEVGPGFGALAAELVSRGFDVHVVDTSRAVCRAVTSRTPAIRAHCGLLSDMPPGLVFDAVVASHVLEHVGDPLCFLRSIRARVRPTGFVSISVPNVQAPEAYLPGWTSFEPYHLTYFGPGQLRRALGDSGFEVDSLWTTEPYSGWPLALLRTITQKGEPRHLMAALAEPPQQGERGPARFAVETAYRTAMFLIGAVIWPARAVQSAVDRGENLSAIARPHEPR